MELHFILRPKILRELRWLIVVLVVAIVVAKHF
jgi:hypothetical protein